MKSSDKIQEGSKIQPDDISTAQHFFNAFGNNEREVSARWIVNFCQDRGAGWKPFVLADIERYYNERGHKVFWFNGLTCPEYGVRLEDDTFYIEHNFIARCWLSSPTDESKGIR